MDVSTNGLGMDVSLGGPRMDGSAGGLGMGIAMDGLRMGKTHRWFWNRDNCLVIFSIYFLPDELFSLRQAETDIIL